MFDKGRLYLAVFLISVSLLSFELLQTRILSVIFWNHLVYLTVTIALLGFGIAGAFLSIFSEKLLRRRETVLSLSSLLYALSLPSAVFLMTLLPTIGSRLSVFAKLVISYNLLVIPFFFAGLAVSLVFTGFSERINRLYFANMVGSGVGAVLFIFLIEPLGAPKLLFLLALMGAVSAFLFTLDRKERRLSLVFLLFFLLFTPLANLVLKVRPEGYKYLGKFTNHFLYPESRVLVSRWTPIARIDLVEDNKRHLLYYLSEFRPTDYKVITIDGDALTPIFSARFFDLLKERAKKRGDVGNFNASYVIRKRPEVLVIGMGGGIDVMSAIAFEARRVKAVEINRAIFELTTKRYNDFNGINFDGKRVIPYNREGRSFIKRDKGQYDIIQINAIDTFAALSSGAYVLSENYLYTVEAFRDYFHHLKKDGILSINRWFLFPPREVLRLSSLALFAYRELGVSHPERNVFVSAQKGGGWAVSLFKRTAFSQEEVKRLLEFCKRSGSTIIFFPKVFPKEEQERLERGYYSQIDDEHLLQASRVFNHLFSSFSQGDIYRFFDTYRYNVRPVWDDRPFFFEYNRVTDIFKIEGFTIRGNWPLFTLYFLFAIASLVVVILIILPLYFHQRKGLTSKGAGAVSIYFIALGVGFMFVEIGLMQKLVLFLGHPIYSISVVLTTLLVFSGLGSYVSGRMGLSPPRVILLSVVMVSAILLSYVKFLPPIVEHFLKEGISFRILLSIGLLAPLSFFMGMPFPSGLRILKERRINLIPWAWGVNGGASVLASVLAIIIAMWFGFLSVVISASLVYLLGAVVFLCRGGRLGGRGG
ncbi:MAG: hypothetical protein J7L64_06935 [Acidobacteria bacterium]|nr:hypothetical protein [Acidobacteriota bacterium]